MNAKSSFGYPSLPGFHPLPNSQTQRRGNQTTAKPLQNRTFLPRMSDMARVDTELAHVNTELATCQVSDFLEMKGTPEPHDILMQKGLLHQWEPGLWFGAVVVFRPAHEAVEVAGLVVFGMPMLVDEFLMTVCIVWSFCRLKLPPLSWELPCVVMLYPSDSQKRPMACCWSTL